VKRTGAILVVTGLAFFLTIPASVAAAKGYKAPKSSCWQLDGTGLPLDGFFLAIALKPSGIKLKDMNGTVKFYSVQGAIAADQNFSPLDGSGYVDPDENEFEGGLDGRVPGTGFVACIFYSSETGSDLTCSVAPNLDSADFYLLTGIDCETLSLN